MQKTVLKGIVLLGIFAVPFLVMVVADSMFFPYITGKNFGFRIIVELMLGAWLLLMLYDTQYRPRFSWIALSGLVFLGVMFVANLFGEYPPQSFWSNFERMEGYVTLVHFYLYFLITGTVLQTAKLWNAYFNTTLIVALLMAGNGLLQPADGGDWRIEGTLGNSTYMAVYMLFHIFIAALMLTRSQLNWQRVYYGALIALFTFVLLQTGTRGAALGVMAGGVVATGYLALCAHTMPRVRKTAFAILGVIVLAVALFLPARDSAFVQSVPMLDRLASISLEAGEVRFLVWGAALEGVQERPWLGWGQENFNYVFNKYYVPELYQAEPWYDRAHNVVLDWLIAGGVLGFAAYSSLYLAVVYYLLVVPLRAWRRGDQAREETFGAPERALLLGLLTAYLVHNMFVFDNVVSYIFFAAILAFVHARIGVAIPKFQAWHAPARVRLVAMVTVPVLTVAVVYAVNAPGMHAASDIIDGLQTANVNARFTALERALARDSFAQQEIVEQMVLSGAALARTPQLPAPVVAEYTGVAEAAMRDFIAQKPNDPRPRLLLANMLRSKGELGAAAKELAAARRLTPQKPEVMVRQGLVALTGGDVAAARQYLQEAYELAPGYRRARDLYAAVLLIQGDVETARQVIADEALFALVRNSTVLSLLRVAEATSTLGRLTQAAAAATSAPPAAHAARAYFLYQLADDRAAAYEALQAAGGAPSESEPFACYKRNMEAGEPFTKGCARLR